VSGRAIIVSSYLAGGAALILGLLLALWSARTQAKAMGQARSGVPILADKADEARKAREVQCADRQFYLGLLLTAVGIALQTLAGILSVP
jgi:hypothetical protein